MNLIRGILLLLICYSCQSNQKSNLNKPDKLNSRIDNFISSTNFNGVIVVAKDTSLMYSKTVGYADFEQKKNLALTDQFIIGSISKQITAVLILREYEKGTIKLEDKIGKYLK